MRLWSKCILLLLGAASSAAAQETGTVAIAVIDAASERSLESVLVHIPALELGGLSDAQGQFTIFEVPAGSHELHAELIGYATATVAVVAGQTTSVELRLAPSAHLLEEVAVTGTAFEESPISLPYAVAVVGREKMEEQGSPQLVDFFKNLSASHGVIGERSSWYNANQAATLAGMNLLNSKPPLANIEQAYDGFTHDPKGRRLKLAVSCGFGG